MQRIDIDKTRLVLKDMAAGERQCWNRGVIEYALDLLLLYEAADSNGGDLWFSGYEGFGQLMLFGHRDWREFSRIGPVLHESEEIISRLYSKKKAAELRRFIVTEFVWERVPEGFFDPSEAQAKALGEAVRLLYDTAVRLPGLDD